MRILLSGASGFIGLPLSSFLASQGHTVVPLIRGEKVPYSIQQEDFEGFDAVIHLAGEPLTLSRWSKEKKGRILSSRTEGTLFLSNLLSKLKHPPQVFLTASAFGYYGNRADEILTEESLAGNSFLSNVCIAWEECANAGTNRNIRTAQMRFGMVLGPNGGALKKMIPLYRMGLGAALGSGTQWVSWIALEDLIRAIDWTLKMETLQGPINFVSPNPVQQKDFSKQLAEVLKRPHLFSIPAPLLRLRFGSVADELLLASARVYPQKLIASNFAFHYPDLRSALSWAVQPGVRTKLDLPPESQI